jgi:thiamine-monophosphate kinase
MKLSEIGEFGFIERVSQQVHGCTGVFLGIGDDAAVTVPTAGMGLLSTADMLVEGVHFDLAWSDPYTLGRKSLAVNLSDIAAMGGVPKYALLSLAVPKQMPLDFLDRFMAGFLEQACRFEVALIGGDTCSSSQGLVINVTLMGEQYPEKIVTRKGALPGDIVCVTGTLGDAGLGLELLRAGERQGYAVKRHLDPEPRVALGRSVADKSLATAMIDISDGVAADLGHIISGSNVGARITVDKVPLSAEYSANIGRFSVKRHSMALSGGEDYELLMTVLPGSYDEICQCGLTAGVNITAIGEITADEGILFENADGSRYDLDLYGYDHFK